MDGYLKFIAMIEAIGYFIYFFLFFSGQIDLPGDFAWISFLLVTFTFITSEVILASIIEVREAVFNRYQGGREPLSTKSKPYSDSQQSQQGTTNILEKGGTLIEENEMIKKWTCSCGFHNPTSSQECLSCTKRRTFMNS
jgi:hypothetical protein